MFASPTQAKLQEIGPRFTLKLRWLRKGLPSVTAPDGRIANGGDAGEGLEADDAEVARQEKMDEDEAMGEMGKTQPATVQDQPVIPPLDQEQEYEWKWKASTPSPTYMGVAVQVADFCSPRWRFLDVHSSCRLLAYACIISPSVCPSHIEYERHFRSEFH